MTGSRRRIATVASVVLGALFGTFVMMAAARDPAPVDSTVAPMPLPTSAPIQRVSERAGVGAWLAWAPGGLPQGAERVAAGTRGIRAVATVEAGQAWLLQGRATGYAVPIDAAAVDPRTYASFVSPAQGAPLQRLTPRTAILARSAARMRGASVGSRLTLRGRTVTVVAVVDDNTTGGYEMLLTRTGPSVFVRAYRYVVMSGTQSAADRAERVLARLLGSDRRLRVRSDAETPFLRYGDAVLPQMLMKETFGEFSARVLPGGAIQPDVAWRERNVTEQNVPLLGRITCHRLLFPQLRAALRSIVARGLGHLIDPSDYGGCYSPRFINSDSGGRLSQHSWGVAIDINVSENRFGMGPHMDDRIVEVFEEQGFTWGGRWLIPDGMHFEWVRFP